MLNPVLKGYSYEGRKLDRDLHQKVGIVMKKLQDPEFVKNRRWGNELQTELGSLVGVKGGSIRTIKRMMEQLRIVKPNELVSSKVPDSQNLLTEEGEIFVLIIELEEKIDELPKEYAGRQQLKEQLDEMYRSFYSKAIFYYYYPEGPRGDSGRLHLLRATLKALRKYHSVDYWEWYLFNTYITEDDNAEQEAQLEQAISAYRSGRYKFDKNKDKPEKYGLSHSYVVRYLQLSGFVKVKGGGYSIRLFEGENSANLKDVVLGNDFLNDFYSGRIKI
ncbi:hypothetical protein [Priestia koreensis]|uniref:hypothetical protein n=1 Tax=Priestia koreensis TaxID=284581 RepID=UPI0034589D4C